MTDIPRDPEAALRQLVADLESLRRLYRETGGCWAEAGAHPPFIDRLETMDADEARTYLLAAVMVIEACSEKGIVP